MLKDIIIDRCECCNVESYVYPRECKDEFCEHPIYRPCTVRKGSGVMEKHVSLQAFQELLDKVNAMEPDWAELAKERPLCQFQDS